MKAKCCVLSLLLYLLLGIVISLLFTWVVSLDGFRFAPGFAQRLSSSYWMGSSTTNTGWMIGEPNADSVPWSIKGVRDGKHRVYQIRYEINYRGYTGVEKDFSPESIPGWTRVSPIPMIEESKSYTRVIEQLNGWPFLAWRGEARIDRLGRGAQYTWCFPSTKQASLTAWDSLVLLPYEPVFPGVFYNAIFFGGILFITVRVIKHTRRRLTDAVRIHRQQCTKCKYNIAGLTTCPECGQPVIPHAGRRGG